MRTASSTAEHTTSELRQRRWRVLVVASMGVFITTLTSSAVSVALPVMGSHLRLSYSEALWVQAAYILVITVMASPVGRLADVHGHVRLYTLGALLFGLSLVAAALSPSGLILVIASGFQGVAAALLLTTNPPLVTAAFPPAERGRALGLNVMAVYLGLSIGPPLGGLVATHLGWRWIFMIAAPFVVAILIGSWSLLAAEQRDRASERERKGSTDSAGRVDTAGTILLGIMLASLFVPLTFSPLWGWSGARTIGLLATAAVLAIVFVFVEGRVKDPLLDLGLLRRNRVFAGANLATFFYFVATFGVTIFTAVFLEVVQGYSAQRTGLVLLVQPAIVVIAAPFAGRLSDRLGSHGLAAVGMTLVAAGMGELALISSAASIWQVLAALATLGVGAASFDAPNVSAVMGSVERSELGVASGVLFTMRSGGQGLSIAVLGAIAASQLGPTGGRLILLGESASLSSSQAFVAGYREAMLVGVGLAIAGALASLARERKTDGARRASRGSRRA